jgi:hypothetical protein
MVEIFHHRKSEWALLAGVVASAVLTGLIWLLGQRLYGVALLPDQGASWYYWKLPEPTVWTRLSPVTRPTRSRSGG